MSANFATSLPPPDEYGRIPAAPPPPGVTPNFDNPVWNGNSVILSTAICTGVSTVFILLRLYTRIWITHAAGFEDALLAFAWLITVAVGVLSILTVMVAGGGHHMWDVPLSTFIPNFFQYIFAGSLSSIMANIFTKLAVVQLLVRISSHLKGLRYAYRGLMVLIFVYNLLMFFLLLFSCSPVKANWYVNITPKKCRPPEDIFRPFSVIDCVFSFILVLAPVPLIRIMRNRMNNQQKWALGLIMGFGLITCIAPVLRIVETYRSVADVTWAISNLLVWWSLELNVSIACASATCLKPFFRRHFPALKALGGSYFGSASKSRYLPGSNVSKPLNSKSGASANRSRNDDLELGAYSGKRRKDIGFESVVMTGANGSGSDGFASGEDTAAMGAKGRGSLGSDRSERELVNAIGSAGGGGTGWAQAPIEPVNGAHMRSHSRVGGSVDDSFSNAIRIDRTFEVRHER